MTPRTGAPGLGLVRLTSRLVPAERRREWLEEWRAELANAAEDALRRGDTTMSFRIRLVGRAAASIVDALSLRRLRGPSGPGPALRDSLRTVRRQPGFVAAVALTLALGLGATTAIFSAVDAILLYPLPFREPDRLVEIGGYGRPVDPDMVNALRNETLLFESVKTHRPRSVILTEAGEPRQLRVEAFEPGFLELLGIVPGLGRGILAEEAVAGRDRVVLLGDEVWRGAFNADPAVIGRTVRLSGESYTVVGVLPPTLRMMPGGLLSAVVPLAPSLEPAERDVGVFARLREGVPLEVASTRVGALAATLDREAPLKRARDARVSTLPAGGKRYERPVLLALAGAVTLLLLIACANAAGLLFVRGVARQSELTVRRALGGTRMSLFRQLLSESLVIAGIAGVLGTLIAWWGVRALVMIAPETTVRWHYNVIALNGRALAFSLAVTVLTGLIFGIAPAAWAAARSGAAPTTTRTATVSRAHMRMRRGVQVVQLALAAMLLCGAGLLGRSFVELMRVDPGFDAGDLVRLSLSPAGDANSPERVVFVRELDRRLRAIPGVSGVAWSNGSGLMFNEELRPSGGEAVPTGGRILVTSSVDTSYFRTMGIPLLQGRAFTAADVAAAPTPWTPPVAGSSHPVVVGRTLAELLWPGTSAVGQSFRTDDDATEYSVVGVVEGARLEGLDDRDLPWVMFLPGTPERMGYARIEVRRDGNPAAAVPVVREAVYSIDPDLPIYELMTERQALAESLDLPRFALTLMTIFGALAILLAAIGVYGLMAFSVAQRSREIGLRMAVGAGVRDIVTKVIGSGMALAAAGLAIGIAGALILSRYIESMLFGITRLDPATYALVVLLLAATTVIALMGPALRAARVDPSTALRQE